MLKTNHIENDLIVDSTHTPHTHSLKDKHMDRVFLIQTQM